MILANLIDIYSLVVLVAVITSWIQLPPHHPVVQFTRMLVEPALAPIRKILPPMGGLDFSPLILLFGLQALKGLLLR
jgi:YggT family protein